MTADNYHLLDIETTQDYEKYKAHLNGVRLHFADSLEGPAASYTRIEDADTGLTIATIFTYCGRMSFNLYHYTQSEA